MLRFLYDWNPTKDQWISYLGTASKWVGSALVARGYTVSPDIAALLTGPEALQFYAGIIMGVLPLVRDRYIHSNAGKLAAASTLATGPDAVIKPIQTLPTAPLAITALAHDDSVPGVVPEPEFPATGRYRS